MAVGQVGRFEQEGDCGKVVAGGGQVGHFGQVAHSRWWTQWV